MALFTPSIMRLRSDGDVAGLIEVAKLGDEERRREAITALVAIGEPSVGPVKRMIGEGRLDFVSVLSALAQTGSEGAAWALVDVALKNEADDARLVARRGVCRIMGEGWFGQNYDFPPFGGKRQNATLAAVADAAGPILASLSAGAAMLATGLSTATLKATRMFELALEFDPDLDFDTFMRETNRGKALTREAQVEQARAVRALEIAEGCRTGIADFVLTRGLDLGQILAHMQSAVEMHDELRAHTDVVYPPVGDGARIELQPENAPSGDPDHRVLLALPGWRPARGAGPAVPAEDARKLAPLVLDAAFAS